MHFLGLYNLFAALAMAGTCSVCADYPDAAPYYGASPAYTMAQQGGGDELPPAGYIINSPPSQVDNGYSPSFYWNQPQDQDDEADDSDDDDYHNRGERYGGGYPPSAYDAEAAAAAADRAYREAYYGGYTSPYQGEYDAGGVSDYGHGHRQHANAGSHREHRDTRARHDRGDRQEAMSYDRRDERHDVERRDQASSSHMASDDRRGYHGHDSHLFDNARRPSTPVASGYQVHRHSDRDRPSDQ
jgi:hypothetical protein